METHSDKKYKEAFEQLYFEDIYDLSEELQEYFSMLHDEGKKIIAFSAHEFVPYPLISALGGHPFPLLFAGDEERTAAGSEFLTNSLCPYAVSLIGAAENPRGKFRFLTYVDAFLGTSYCAADNLIHEWNTELTETSHLYLHIPFLPRFSHKEYFEKNLQKFAEHLSHLTGTSCSQKDLMEKINTFSLYFRSLQKLADSPLLTGVQRNRMIQKALLFGPFYFGSDFDTLVDNAIAYAVDLNKEKGLETKTPLLVCGGSCFIGDPLFEIIEESGGWVKVDYTWTTIFPHYDQIISLLKEDLEENKTHSSHEISPYEILSLDFYLRRASLHFTDEDEPLSLYLKTISEYVKKHNVKGVLNHIIKFCDLTGHHRHYIRDSLRNKGIPILNLEKDYSSSMLGQLRTRIEAFIEMIEG